MTKIHHAWMAAYGLHSGVASLGPAPNQDKRVGVPQPRTHNPVRKPTARVQFPPWSSFQWNDPTGREKRSQPDGTTCSQAVEDGSARDRSTSFCQQNAMNTSFLLKPDQVGSSEYRAIHEIIEGAEDADEAIAICEEFMECAASIKQAIIRNQP